MNPTVEVAELRARLALMEKQRDSRHELAGQAAAEVLNLRARLAGVEADLRRDRLGLQAVVDDRDVLAARLAAVEAMCDATNHAVDADGFLVVRVSRVRAVVRGEGDRPAEHHCDECGHVGPAVVWHGDGTAECARCAYVRPWRLVGGAAGDDHDPRGEGDRPAFDPNCLVCDHNAHTCPGCGADTNHARPVCGRCGEGDR